MQEKLLALPTTLTTFDGPEDYWLLLTLGPSLARVFSKSHALEECLRKQELMRVTFLANWLSPVTGLLWSKDALAEAIGEEHLTKEVRAALEREQFFAIPHSKFPEPSDRTRVVRTESSIWVDVSPQHRKGVYIELFGYAKYGDQRFYSEVPSELVDHILTRFPPKECS